MPLGVPLGVPLVLRLERVLLLGRGAAVVSLVVLLEQMPLGLESPEKGPWRFGRPNKSTGQMTKKRLRNCAGAEGPTPTQHKRATRQMVQVKRLGHE
jgi:hypothetical protein